MGVSFGLHGHDFLALTSFGAHRVRCVLGLTRSLGGTGCANGRNGHLRNGGVTLVFRGDSAHAHYSFRINTGSRNTRMACLNPSNSRVNRGRSIGSATHMLNKVFSNVRCHNFSRHGIRVLTGCSNIPI